MPTSIKASSGWREKQGNIPPPTEVKRTRKRGDRWPPAIPIKPKSRRGGVSPPACKVESLSQTIPQAQSRRLPLLRGAFLVCANIAGMYLAPRAGDCWSPAISIKPKSRRGGVSPPVCKKFNPINPAPARPSPTLTLRVNRGWRRQAAEEERATWKLAFVLDSNRHFLFFKKSEKPLAKEKKLCYNLPVAGVAQG